MLMPWVSATPDLGVRMGGISLSSLAILSTRAGESWPCCLQDHSSSDIGRETRGRHPTDLAMEK